MTRWWEFALVVVLALVAPSDHPTSIEPTVGLLVWFTGLLLTPTLAATRTSRQLEPILPAPSAAGWTAAFALWALACTMLGLFSRWLWIGLVPVLLYYGSRLALKAGWPGRRAWYWSAGSLSGTFAYLIVSGILIFRFGQGHPLGFWLLGVPVWVAWLLVRRRQAKPLYKQPASPDQA